MAQHLGESVDSGIPQSLVGFQPVVCALEWTRVNAAVVNASAHCAFHKSRLLQGLDVLRCCCKGHAIGSRKLSYGLLSFREPLEHRSPRSVTERAKHKIESLMFNHKVEYIQCLMIVNRSVEYVQFAEISRAGVLFDLPAA